MVGVSKVCVSCNATDRKREALAQPYVGILKCHPCHFMMSPSLSEKEEEVGMQSHPRCTLSGHCRGFTHFLQCMLNLPVIPLCLWVGHCYTLIRSALM